MLASMRTVACVPMIGTAQGFSYSGRSACG
jgi:hypothetical protein